MTLYSFVKCSTIINCPLIGNIFDRILSIKLNQYQWFHFLRIRGFLCQTTFKLSTTLIIAMVSGNDVFGLLHFSACVITCFLMIYWLVPFYSVRNHPLMVKRQSHLTIVKSISLIVGQILSQATWAIYYSEFSFLPLYFSKYSFWISTLVYPWTTYIFAIAFLLRYVSHQYNYI